MKKEFVPQQESIELKELGFNEPCFGWYNWTGTDLILTNNSYIDINPTNAPTFSQAFRWFREKHNIPSNLELLEEGWDYVTYTDVIEEINYNDGPFQTYEEAELACLKKLIEIVKNK